MKPRRQAQSPNPRIPQRARKIRECRRRFWFEEENGSLVKDKAHGRRKCSARARSLQTGEEFGSTDATVM
jgi:ribosomal protein S21